jgi:uncharacterized Fe-S cluster protein YjdI
MSKEHVYTNGEVSIVWKKDLCTHSTRCWHELGEVFKPGDRPWIKPEGASTEKIISQVKRCPSGALTYFMNATGNAEPEPSSRSTTGVVVNVMPDGPLIIHGPCSIRMADGSVVEREGNVAFCRCGRSSNKPFCDGSHLQRIP